MVFKNGVYDKLKWIVQYFIPALEGLWLTMSDTWNLPYGTQIGTTIAAIGLFIGVMLGISKAHYKGEGTLTVNSDDPDKDIYNLELNVEPEELPNMKSVTFIVKDEEE